LARLASKGPFDGIIVTAAAAQLPNTKKKKKKALLLDQTYDGGGPRLIIPVGDEQQSFECMTARGNSSSKKLLSRCVFVLSGGGLAMKKYSKLVMNCG